jgi:DNA transformation protein
MPPAKDQDFLDFVIDQLAGFSPVSSRRMFGGIGLYQGETFFAIIDDGKLYFVTDEATRGRYESRGMKPFEYAPGKVLVSYFEVPVDVLENDRDLCEWARAAVSIQKARRATREPQSPNGNSRQQPRSRRDTHPPRGARTRSRKRPSSRSRRGK